MSKRTPGLPQRPRGFWPTPRDAVLPLLDHLPRLATYGEPCAGDGSLVTHLRDLWPGGTCGWASDIVPQMAGIPARDALAITPADAADVDLWITNPPWPVRGRRGDPALGIIRHLMTLAPVWALLPFDFACTDYSTRVWAEVSDVVPIGRVSWLGNGEKGKDNSAWLRFDAQNDRKAIIHIKKIAA